MNIRAILGNEHHTTSSGWGKLSINGIRKSYREAVSHKFLTPYGDRHAMWVECVFQVKPEDLVRWEAGANYGSRGSQRARQDLSYRVASDAAVIQTPELPYPAQDALLEGRLVLIGDRGEETAAIHEAQARDL